MVDQRGALARRAMVAVALVTVAALGACSAHRPGAPSGTPSANASRGTGTPGSAVGTNPSPSLRVTVPAAERGTVLTRYIPGLTSGFHARDAQIYLPAILRREPNRSLPVIELLHGTSGSPSNLFMREEVPSTLDAFAAAHGGAAPIVVAPDINGSLHADTECVLSHAGGDVEKYLSVDVPRYMDTHFAVRSNRQSWAVAGLSEGGTCSIMLALRSSQTYSVFGDFSGLTRPTVGESDQPAATIKDLFGGSRKAFDEHDPLWLMAHHRFRSLAGWFDVGDKDVAARAAQSRLAAAARSAGVGVRAVVVPGRHSTPTWIASIRQFLPWAWTRLAG